jgi:tRNA G18 (ribose-2'-O)-methylase SpoU
MKADRGYYGIGIQNVKTAANIGTLWRSAFILGASFIFTIGNRYKRQAGDTTESWRHIPLYNYPTFDEFYKAMPYDCRLVGIELTDTSIPIVEYKHPERCIYLLGAEDSGLSNEAVNKCHELIILPGSFCMNVSVAGSIVLFDRNQKRL